MVGTSLSNAEGMGSFLMQRVWVLSLVRELRCHIPHGLVTNLIF